MTTTALIWLRFFFWCAYGLAAMVVVSVLATLTYSEIVKLAPLQTRRRFVSTAAEKPIAREIAHSAVLSEWLYDAPINAGRGVDSAAGTIVVVGSNSCRTCPAAWAMMPALQDALPTAETWYVDVDSRKHSSVDAPPVPAVSRSMHPKDRDAAVFAAHTGIRVMPSIYVFKSPIELACIFMGVPSDEDLTACTVSLLTPQKIGSTKFFRNITLREPIPGVFATEGVTANANE